MTRSLLRRGAVVNEPYLVATAGTQHDLVQFRIVIERIHVVPERGRGTTVAGHIHQFRMPGRVPMVWLGRVEILHQMVPDVPFPDNPPPFRRGRLDLHHGIRHQKIVPQESRIKPCRDGLLPGFALHHQRQDVAVWHRLDVVVQLIVPGGVVKLPDQVALPIILLDAPPLTTARAPLHPKHARPHKMTIRKQVGGLSRFISTLPLVNHTPVVIYQIRDGIVLRRHQRVSLESLGTVEKQPHGLTGIRRCWGLVFRHLTPPATASTSVFPALAGSAVPGHRIRPARSIP